MFFYQTRGNPLVGHFSSKFVSDEVLLPSGPRNLGQSSAELSAMGSTVQEMKAKVSRRVMLSLLVFLPRAFLIPRNIQ